MSRGRVECTSRSTPSRHGECSLRTRLPSGDGPSHVPDMIGQHSTETPRRGRMHAALEQERDVSCAIECPCIVFLSVLPLPLPLIPVITTKHPLRSRYRPSHSLCIQLLRRSSSQPRPTLISRKQGCFGRPLKHGTRVGSVDDVNGPRGALPGTSGPDPTYRTRRLRPRLFRWRHLRRCVDAEQEGLRRRTAEQHPRGLPDIHLLVLPQASHRRWQR